MVSESKWRVNAQAAYKDKGLVNCTFILARNYKVFVQDMDSFFQVNLSLLSYVCGAVVDQAPLS